MIRLVAAITVFAVNRDSKAVLAMLKLSSGCRAATAEIIFIPDRLNHDEIQASRETIIGTAATLRPIPITDLRLERASRTRSNASPRASASLGTCTGRDRGGFDLIWSDRPVK